MDGALQLDAIEKELVHESFVVDTRDHEDHTFCGIMFDAECETLHPAEYIEVSSLFVRGHLGPMTVWTTPNTFQRKQEEKDEWTQVYAATHPPKPHDYTQLTLDQPIRLYPGERCGIYVHSALPGDEGIVYDNQRKHITFQDRCLKVHPGYAHLSNRPFGKHGFWGRPWRNNREFVGRMEYGVRWRMWQPNDIHRSFPVGFQKTVRRGPNACTQTQPLAQLALNHLYSVPLCPHHSAPCLPTMPFAHQVMTMIMGSRRTESILYLLQDELVWFIMNKCSWDWWGADCPPNLLEAAGSSQGGERTQDSPPTRRQGGSALYEHAALYASLLGNDMNHYFANHGLLNPDDSDDDDDEYVYSDEEEEEEEEEEESDDNDGSNGEEVEAVTPSAAAADAEPSAIEEIE